MPRLLLHACCGICSSSVLEYLTQYFEITLLWYNPNLYPESEFDRRLEAQMQIISAMGLSDIVRIAKLPWGKDEYYSRIAGLENEPEGGARCEKCIYERMAVTAAQAAKGGYDYFATTLTVSPHKNAQMLNEIGKELEKEYGVKYLYADFKKKDGYKKSVKLSEEYNLYRQDYCGCRFALSQQKGG